MGKKEMTIDDTEGGGASPGRFSKSNRDTKEGKQNGKIVYWNQKCRPVCWEDLSLCGWWGDPGEQKTNSGPDKPETSQKNEEGWNATFFLKSGLRQPF